MTPAARPADTPPRVVVVTGASSGIGQATALQAADAGESVVLVARGRELLEEVAEECRERGAAAALPVAADVRDDDAVAALVARVLAEHGRIDAVVHCAGVVAYGRTEQVPAEVFDGVVGTNLQGSANIARHVVPVLRRQRRGALVLVGSVIGHIGVPTMSAYVVSKWGIRALARTLQIENRDLPDVHISHLAPGGVDTPIYQQAANYSGFVGRPPPPVATPERVAAVALQLVDRPRRTRQVGLANPVMRFGFTALPALYDALVGPLFAVGAKDRTDPVEPTPGNVLAPRQLGNRLRGGQGWAPVGIARNLRQVAGRAWRRGR